MTAISPIGLILIAFALLICLAVFLHHIFSNYPPHTKHPRGFR